MRSSACTTRNHFEFSSCAAKSRASRPPSSRTKATLTTVVSSDSPYPNRNRKVSGNTTAMIQLEGSRVTCFASLSMTAASCCHQECQRAPRAERDRSEEHSLNSSHVKISYAVFCLKKKKKKEE